MHRVLFCFFLLLCCSGANWFPASIASFTPSVVNNLSTRDVLYSIAAKCFLEVVPRQSINCFRLNNGELEFDGDYDLAFTFNGVTKSVNIQEVRYCPLFFTSSGSFATSADLFIQILVYITFRDTDGSPYFMPLANCFKVSNVALNNITGDAPFSPVDDFTEFPYALFFSTQNPEFPNKVFYSLYYLSNIAVTAGPISIYNGNLQTASTGLQLPSSWVKVWQQAFYSYFIVVEPDRWAAGGGWSLSCDNVFIFNAPETPFIADSSSRIVFPPSILRRYFENDYDQGGQFDFSEWLLGKNMLDPKDDNPNNQQEIGDLVSVTYPGVPGSENVDSIEGTYIDPIPTDENAPYTIEDLNDDLENELQSNAGYRLLRTLINPNGFNTSAELPSYTIPFSLTIDTFNWSLPDIVIDFNKLKTWGVNSSAKGGTLRDSGQSSVSPMWQWFMFLRQLMVLVLFIMTFLACYGIYEKSLAYSA